MGTYDYHSPVSEIERSSHAVERVVQGRGAVENQYVEDEEPGTDWSRQLAVLRRHQVSLGALAMIAASLIWKAEFLRQYNFRQDDLQVMDVALKNGLTWSYLTHVDVGHLFPGVYACAWILARVALYNWAAGATVILILVAGASLAAWRVLRTLLGNRPAILIPLALYLLTPLNFPDISWWISAVEAIPLQIALFMALDAHVRYVRTDRIQHAYSATGWLVFGLFFFEKSVLIAPLLFAVTVGYLVPRRRLIDAVRTATRCYWRSWVLYLALLALYVIVFFVALGSSSTQPNEPASLATVLTYSWDLVFRTFVPGALGGPWHWWHPAGSSGAYSLPSVGVCWLALIVVLVIIAASILTRRRAWRAWVVLPGWLLLADVVPVVISRLAKPGWAGLLGTSPRYVADATAVLTIVVALVFWPVASQTTGDSDVAPRRDFFTGSWRTAATAVVAVAAVGSFWSVADLSAGITIATGPYLANAAKALAAVPDGAVIVNQLVPSQIMIPAFERSAEESTVLGPLVPRGTRVTWTAQPTGNLGQLMIFGTDGRLYTAAIQGVSSTHVSAYQDCLKPRQPQLVIPLPAQPGNGSDVRVLRVGYLAGSGAAGYSLTVTYNLATGTVPILPGVHNAYFTVTGTATKITVHSPAASVGGVCFEKAVVGYFVPLPGSGIPKAAAG